MYDGPQALATTGAGITIAGAIFDVTTMIAGIVLLVTMGTVLILRARSAKKKAPIL